MGSLYRSEPVTLCQLFLQSEAAFNCLAELGELGLVQFKDVNTNVSAFQRKYVSEVRRCEEMQRKLRYLETEMNQDSIPIVDRNESPETPAPREMTDMETTFEKLENETREVNSSYESLKMNHRELTELKHVLKHADVFFADQPGQDNFLPDPNAGQESGNLGFVAGVILRDRFPSFERLLWRSCRGNVLIRNADIETNPDDSETVNEDLKSVFMVFYQGDNLKTRVKKVCDGFRAAVHTCPETLAERSEMAAGVNERIKDLQTVLNQTQTHRREVLCKAAENIRVWTIKVKKLKAIFFTLNLFNIDITQKFLIGECWVPITHWDRIQMALQRGAEKSGCGMSAAILNRLETREQPPTYNRTNKFTAVFQGIVDSYGVASYMEVNPAPFTIVSFPFLFSLMFGDAGHGIIVFLAALFLVLFEKRLGAKKSDNEIWNIFFGGRYIILLMGIFSIYSGFIYNDFFSKSVNIFGSAWFPSPDRFNQTNVLSHTAEITLDPTNNTDYRGHPYPFGMDPIWQLTKNKITWTNSFKMKISIIFGVSQMMFGVVLSLQNHRYFKDPVNIFCEFIPEMIFLISIFGYLIVLILYKWIAYDATRAACAPSLLIDLINMFLMNYPSDPCSSVTFYPSQQAFQTALLLMVVICIPWLLLPKPLILRSRHKKTSKAATDRDLLMDSMNGNGEYENVAHSSTDNKREFVSKEAESEDTIIQVEVPVQKPTTAAASEGGGGGHGGGHGHGEEFEFGEAFVHQCIHTIEYCLGCISHTASYLRLWALSLAHAELSEVLWNMVMHMGFTLLNGYASCVTIFVIFTPWAVLTVAILLLMEGLSAFLHTLRLHWVEFQSKFYKGEGYPFEPFSFKKILNAEE